MDATRRPTVVVLHGADRPPRMASVERRATVRYATSRGLADTLSGADVVFVWDRRGAGLEQAWPWADEVRWVHAAASSTGHLLFPALVDSDVVVTNARGIFDQPVAEYVLTVMLAFAKDLPTTFRLQQRRLWQHRETERLAGSTALIVGTGPIGRAVARTLRAVGVTVAGAGAAARADDSDFGTVTALADLRSVIGDHDYVVLALPLTPATTGLIDQAALRSMRPTARLVTVARRGLVSLPDLVDALDHGEIGGAAIEVFADEPLPPSSPLWDMPNVLISPHMSGDVKGWREELVRLFEDNLDRYLQGLPLRNEVAKPHSNR